MTWTASTLARSGSVSNDARAMTSPEDREARALWMLIVATALCYAIGYPVALIGHSNVGWVLVALGGPLLIAVIALVIRRVQR
jgi:hypothetical protein